MDVSTNIVNDTYLEIISGMTLGCRASCWSINCSILTFRKRGMKELERMTFPVDYDAFNLINHPFRLALGAAVRDTTYRFRISQMLQKD